jgi:hypothetical protein
MMLKRFFTGIGVHLLAAIVGLGSVVISDAQTAGSVPFEALSYCGQLDAIDRAGKSVARFIAESDHPAGYLWAVKTQCNWHSEQAAQGSQPDPIARFETLSYCDQLDALARARKSIAEFILNASDPSGYIWAGRSQGSWHREQAEVASLVLNPPAPAAVATRNSTARPQAAFYPSMPQSLSRRAAAPRVEINSFVSEPPAYNYNSDF